MKLKDIKGTVPIQKIHADVNGIEILNVATKVGSKAGEKGRIIGVAIDALTDWLTIKVDTTSKKNKK